MPTTETAELLDNLPKEVETPVLAVIGNRVVPPPSDPDAIDQIAAAAIQGDLRVAADAACLSKEIAADQAPHLERLRGLGPPFACVPLIGWEHHDLAATRRIAHELAENVAKSVEASAS
jgi:hypothetical protein